MKTILLVAFNSSFWFWPESALTCYYSKLKLPIILSHLNEKAIEVILATYWLNHTREKYLVIHRLSWDECVYSSLLCNLQWEPAAVCWLRLSRFSTGARYWSYSGIIACGQYLSKTQIVELIVIITPEYIHVCKSLHNSHKTRLRGNVQTWPGNVAKHLKRRINLELTKAYLRQGMSVPHHW